MGSGVFAQSRAETFRAGSGGVAAGPQKRLAESRDGRITPSGDNGAPGLDCRPACPGDALGLLSIDKGKPGKD